MTKDEARTLLDVAFTTNEFINHIPIMDRSDWHYGHLYVASERMIDWLASRIADVSILERRRNGIKLEREKETG